MKTKRIIVAAAAAAAVVGGSAGAIAATKQDEGKKAEQAVLDDAAKRLNVAPTELRDALAKARDAQLDQAVKDGRLTQQQADAIKARHREDGRVLGGGGRGHHGPGHHGLRARGLLEPAADALGLTRRELATQLRAGKTLTEIAKAENKDLADVRAAVKKAATERLDAAVKAGRITDAQRDEKLSRLDEHFDRFAEGKWPGHGGRGSRFGPPPGAPEAP